MGELYQISFPNGKGYIGITAGSAAARMAEHTYNAESGRGQYAIHRALRKHGGTCGVNLRVLLVADSWEYLCLMERRAIEAYGTFGRGGYNMTAGGEGTLGYRHDAETLRRMGAVHKGLRPRLGAHLSDEAKAKISAAHKGRRLSPGHCAKIAAALRGNQYSRGIKQSAETVERRSAALVRRSKGVSWCKYTNKWRAFICPAGKMKTIGRFTDYGEALAARAAAVAALLGGTA